MMAKLQQSRYRQWERSLEGVAYQLDLYPFVEDDVKIRQIAAVVQGLPGRVRQFVYDRCRFIWPEDDLGYTVPGDVFIGVWVIMLRYDLPAADVPSTIAHEIAHAYRGDDFRTATPDCEIAAAELAASWGFAGSGADVDRIRHVYRLCDPKSCPKCAGQGTEAS